MYQNLFHQVKTQQKKTNKYIENIEYYNNGQVVGSCQAWNWQEGWIDNGTFPGWSYKCLDGKVVRIKLNN